MKHTHLLTATLLAGTAAFSANASTVLYDSSNFVQGQQSFVQAFDITTAGTLTVSLSDIPLWDAVSGLGAFVTTSNSVLTSTAGAKSMGAGTASFSVGPGMVYTHWFGDAAGAYGVGLTGLSVQFQPGAPVPLPGTLGSMLCGLGLLLGWQRRQALTIK